MSLKTLTQRITSLNGVEILDSDFVRVPVSEIRAALAEVAALKAGISSVLKEIDGEFVPGAERKTYSSPEVAMDRIRSVTRTALTELDVAYMQNRIKNEPGFALSLLKSAGILDSSGNLARPYKED